MHEMQIIATGVPVCPSVSLLHDFTRLWRAKTAERIELLFGIVGTQQGTLC